jgi:hypothetical protein
MTKPATWGALRAHWDHFALTLGLTADLLPVVANPDAPISENSKMREKGKTPSTYNRDRKVVGFPEWTRHETSAPQVKRWAADSDLGICVQTRRMRAIDVDVVDAALATEVRECIEAYLFAEGFYADVALRVRGNSPKFLMPVLLDGTYAKRTIRTAHGIIEFLANGQQFVAVSTHPSGERYTWIGNGSTDVDGLRVPVLSAIPKLTQAQFEGLWSLLQERFGVAPGVEARRGGAQPTRPRDIADVSDPLLDYLERKGWVVDYQGDGRVDVRCPWELEHTTDSGSSATTYFPRGVGGFQQGHWRCLHAHCAHRGDGDFAEAVGWNADGMPLVLTQAEFDGMELSDGIPEGVEVQIVADNAPEVVSDLGGEHKLPAFKRDGRTGKIKATINNLLMALGDIRCAGVYVGYDAFTDALMLAEAVLDADGLPVPVPVHQRQWAEITEARRVELKAHLERGAQGFEPIGKELMRDAMIAAGERGRFDSAIEWLRHRVPEWDGTPRVAAFFSRYFAVRDTAYHRAVGRYLWTALAGRVLQPGCKADMVPLLIGRGGSGKSTGVAAMAPSVETFTEISLAHRDDNLSRQLRGVLVGELGELRGLATRDRESILAWITRTHEEWTPKFMEYKTRFPRRCVFIGTTNREQALVDDEAGLRRWLPVHVGDTDRGALEADREQLWAEARRLFDEGGVAWAEADKLAAAARRDATEADPWQEAVVRWLLEPEFGEADGAPPQPRWMQPFSGAQAAAGALGVPAKNFGRVEQLRLSAVFRALGARRVMFRVGGQPVKGYRIDDVSGLGGE